MIELRDAVKRYGYRNGVDALRGVTLRVERGEVCAIAGPNGAGKSTLLALVLGFIRPTAGTVLLDGEPPRERHRLGGVAYLPERFTLPPFWNVRDALRGLAALDGAPSPRQRVDEALTRFGLDPLAARPIGELSRGTIQRVGLAQAWLAPADVLVLDEPTEGLDPLWRIRLRALVAERREAGAAVLIASHDLHELEQVADRVVLLSAGVVSDVIPARAPAGAGTWRIRLLDGSSLIAEVFPSAVASGDAFVVEVADAHELSARIAALLERGAVLGEVTPVSLEERVGPTFSGEAGR